MLKRAQSPKKTVELYGRGEMATMESWVEVRIFCYFCSFRVLGSRTPNPTSSFFFAIENIISYWFFLLFLNRRIGWLQNSHED